MLLLLARLLHIATVLALVAGLVGRLVTFRQALRSSDWAVITTLLDASAWFDRYLVIPGSMLVLLSGGGLAGIAHWPFRRPDGWPTWLGAALILYLSLIPVIALVLAPRRREREAAVKDTIAKQRITAELARALGEPSVMWARRYEWFVIIGTLTLMVLKPF